MIGDPADLLISFEVDVYIEVTEAKHKSMKKLSLLKRPKRPNAQIIPPPQKVWGRPESAAPAGVMGGASGIFGIDHGLGGVFGESAPAGSTDPLTAWFLRAGGGSMLGGGSGGESQSQSVNNVPQTFDVRTQSQLFFVPTVDDVDIEQGELRTAQDVAEDDEREIDSEDEIDDEPGALERVPESIRESLVTAYKLGKTYVSDINKESFFLVDQTPGRIEVLHSIKVQKVRLVVAEHADASRSSVTTSSAARRSSSPSRTSPRRRSPCPRSSTRWPSPAVRSSSA